MSLNVRCGGCGKYATWTPEGYRCDCCGWVDDFDPGGNSGDAEHKAGHDA